MGKNTGVSLPFYLLDQQNSWWYQQKLFCQTEPWVQTANCIIQNCMVQGSFCKHGKIPKTLVVSVRKFNHKTQNYVISKTKNIRISMLVHKTQNYVISKTKHYNFNG